MNKSLSVLLLSIFLCCNMLLQAQQIDLENLRSQFGKGKPYKFSGGLSASSVFNAGDGGGGRSPFAWYLNGSLNLNLLGKVNLPFSFNLTNAGAGYTYPSMPNRLSLHPSYKGVTGHFGDVSMNFSPYTLNGHQFSGVGVEINTSKDWNFSAMYGRLLKANEYDSITGHSAVAYRRMSYGFKGTLQQEKYALAASFFYAKDDAGSLITKPDSMGIFPQVNMAASLSGMLRPAKGFEITAEIANSAITTDSRDPGIKKESKGNLMRWIMYETSNTYYYKAFKTNMNYTIEKSTIGIGYEYIDPGYRTLGTYYMNNDLENITLNFSQSLLKSKANLSMNMGFQRDDLNRSKTGTTNRVVGALNLNYAPNEKLNTSLSYSSFQTYMYIRPQFELINATNPDMPMDTLNFKQISQNISLNAGYNFGRSKKKRHMLNMNLSMQSAADIQDDVLRKGNGSSFYNANTAYSLMLVPQQTSITAAFNLSYNTIGRNDFLTLGPTLGANSRLFNRKMTAGFSTSYNASMAETQQSSVLTLRANAGYIFLKSHNVSLSAIEQMRWSAKQTSDLTVTLGYNYTF